MGKTEVGFALGGEAVFLETAVRLVGDGSLDEAGFKSG